MQIYIRLFLDTSEYILHVVQLHIRNGTDTNISLQFYARYICNLKNSGQN